MTAWTSDELNKIGKAEELHLASLRRDGTPGNPVTIWVVRQGDDLYVRPVKGRAGWYRGTQVRHEGNIQAGGVNNAVTFVNADADPDLNNQIDEVYRTKYRRYAANIVGSVLTPDARSATLKLVPR